MKKEHTALLSITTTVSMYFLIPTDLLCLKNQNFE